MSDNNRKGGLSRFVSALGRKPAAAAPSSGPMSDLIVPAYNDEMAVGYEAAPLPATFRRFETIAEARKGVHLSTPANS